MKVLESNITNLFGNKGQKWLDNIPNIVSKLADKWVLANVIPVSNMTFNYVAKALKDNITELPRP